VADLNFTALPGEIVALVGPAGAGKSTALALLRRLFDPQAGSVKIDGMDIRGLKLSALRRNIGVVLRSALFHRSIADDRPAGSLGRGPFARPARKRWNSSNAIPNGSRLASANAGTNFRAASASAFQSHARCSKIRRS
jgi:ATP-binding cassette subfamily B protein